MSELEQLVPSLDLCQKLKAAGFPQDTALVLIEPHELDDDNDEPTIFPRVDTLDDEGSPMWNFVAAPTAEEILKELPRGYNPTPLLDMVRDWYPGKSLAKEAAHAYLLSREGKW